ncbi:hypothetical protein O6H91_06G030200 [Diphasiastrum complanatum]|uniref:Uncharacterized protein n=1 Tax=Diphasiastrum complanatum TaxID=34168 RepID=A0ACC2DC49_DIPCM|nr:hypothetical protein O6H91_06G030200 [Diphasiastrum complanatum]
MFEVRPLKNAVGKHGDAAVEADGSLNGGKRHYSRKASQLEDVSRTLQYLKRKVEALRCAYVKERVKRNEERVKYCVDDLVKQSQGVCKPAEEKKVAAENRFITIYKARSDPDQFDNNQGDADIFCHEVCVYEEGESVDSDFVESNSDADGKIIIVPEVLSAVERLPPFTSWIYTRTNGLMGARDSIKSRRRIYYEGCETCFCSDSEEEAVTAYGPPSPRFSKTIDFIIERVIKKHGSGIEVLNELSRFFKLNKDAIEERYCLVLSSKERNYNDKVEASDHDAGKRAFSSTLNLDKQDAADESDSREIGEASLTRRSDISLAQAILPYDLCFCRRCLIFNCKLHGLCRDGAIVYPSQTHPPWNSKSEFEGTPISIPCGPDCYLWSQSQNAFDGRGGQEVKTQVDLSGSGAKIVDDIRTGSKCLDRSSTHKSSDMVSIREFPVKNPDQSGVSSTQRQQQAMDNSPSESREKLGKGSSLSLDSNLQITLFTSEVGDEEPRHVGERSDVEAIKGEPSISSHCTTELDTVGETFVDLNPRENAKPTNKDQRELLGSRESSKQNSKIYENVEANGLKRSKLSLPSWSVFERDLFHKGVAVFGDDNCLIARNMLKGLKTCFDVSEYRRHWPGFPDKSSYSPDLIKIPYRTETSNNSQEDAYLSDDSFTEKEHHHLTQPIKERSRKKPKYTDLSKTDLRDPRFIGHLSRRYVPCACEGRCTPGICACTEGSFCEKYCACSAHKCWNRFKGCHCSRSQCNTKHCPCLAASRECDPDVCTNCWLGCGDNEPPSLSSPSPSPAPFSPFLSSSSCGGSRKRRPICKNMKLLLHQHAKLLMGRSDVAGWGVFCHVDLKRNDLIGEYTGELISHREADRRGRVFDRETAFLFNLNDRHVIDAFRKGSKLKFANHSLDPNCDSRVVMVAGDHRVAIFAKHDIPAGTELLFDYRYDTETAPPWAIPKPPDLILPITSTAPNNNILCTS